MRIGSFVRALAVLAGSVFAVAPAVAAPPPAADAQAVAAKIDAYMDAAVRHDHFAGSILVARDGKPLLSKGYGMASYELQVPNQPDTVFRIASLTKQFTAMAVMQLQEQGRLQIGDSVCKYLDDCPAAWQPVTLRHLLTHGSGIPNVSSLPTWDEDLGLKRYRRPELVRLFRDLPLDFAPGEKFKYSNSGYFLLGLVIERASGKSYGDFLRDGIFAPLGMAHSLFDDNRKIIPGRATGYYSRGSEFISAPFIDPTTTFSAGGITSTTGDLLRWDQALYTDKLVSRRSLDEIFTANQGGYGFGWQLGERLGRRKTEHSGSLNGFSAYILRFPDERVTVIVLSNSDRASAGRTGSNLAAIVFGAPYELPGPQLRDSLWDTIVRSGADAAIGQYRQLLRTQPDAPGLGEQTLVDLGYDLADGRKLAEAIAIFRFGLELFPNSAYSYDGLADVAIEQGQAAKAIEYFEKSLSLDPTNTYASEGLERARRASK
jgi:CubicO group peptidase (beta-lactamase class C family)